MDLRDQLQKTLGAAYTLERELGGGGMSRVFLAEETRLRRKVVIKVLSPELAQGISVGRFEREIQTAAALQQANIVPVLAAGDTDGLPFYSMPFVEGESLRARLGRGPFAVTEVIGIVRDVAKALAYAHARGVVHRDIKPDNVLLSGGTAVVVDFGIAKAISAARTGTGGATLTQIGTSIGTPAYMSPEQAAGDPDIDHRADIYSLGAMAFELLAGQSPFASRTPQRMLAAHMSEVPRSVAELRPDAPAPLVELVMRCLAKSPDDRPQHGADIVRVLDSVTSSGAGSVAPVVLAGGQIRLARAVGIWAAATLLVALTAWAATAVIGLPEWVLPGSFGVMLVGLPIIFVTAYVQRTAYRLYTATPAFTPGGNTAARGTMATLALKASPHVSWRRTWMGGGIAVGGFAALVLAFMVMRALGIGPAGSLMGKGAFGAKETIVVADFRSPAGDSTLGVTASEALRTDLAQSTSLKVLTKAAVSEILRLMKRPAEGGVPYELAREIASREGAKAVLDGSIVQLGSSYVISARLVGALDGAELAQFRRTARNPDDLVPALGALSKDIRSKVGESLRNVHESNPLERVTTSSLPALKKYVEGIQIMAVTGDMVRGRVLLEQAVALDSTFAMAWRRIAAEKVNEPGGQEQAHAAISQAFRYRERLSENERLLTEAGYYDWGPKPDRERAIAAYESLIERDSTSPAALNNVAILYNSKRDFARAEERWRRATAVATPFGSAFGGLAAVQLTQKKLSAAESTVAKFEKRLSSHGELPSVKASLAVSRGEIAGAESLLRAAFPSLHGEAARSIAAGYLAGLAAMRGRLRDAERWTAQTVTDSAGTRAGAAERLSVMLDSAWVQGYFLSDAAASRATVRRALTQVPMESLSPADRPWTSLLRIAAVTHDAAAARSYAVALERDLATSRASTIVGYRAAARGVLAMAENRHKEAAALFAEAHKGDVGVEDIGPWRAQAFDLADQPDSAIAEFERYVATPDVYLQSQKDFLAGSHKRLGELYDAKGNTAKALEHYGKFVELWKDADPELQPKVHAARARIDELRRKGLKG